MTTLPEVLARVDEPGSCIEVLWVTPDQHRVQQIARWIKEHHLPMVAQRDPVPDARVWVARGQEGYRCGDARLAIVTATTPARLRGMSADLVVLPGGTPLYLPVQALEALGPILRAAEVTGW